MSKSIVIVGFGPGISTAVAEKFGKQGFSVALVARNQQRLNDGVAALKANGINAAAFVADAGDAAQIRGAIAKARAAFDNITAIHWNAYSGSGIDDILTADTAAVNGVFGLAIGGLLASVQEALSDLKAAKGAVLVTNGAFGESGAQIDAFAIQMKSTGVALANAAKHKLVGLLAQRLKDDGVYVGEVMVAGIVKGTGFDSGGATIDAADVAGKFWNLYSARGENYDRIA